MYEAHYEPTDQDLKDYHNSLLDMKTGTAMPIPTETREAQILTISKAMKTVSMTLSNPSTKTNETVHS